MPEISRLAQRVAYAHGEGYLSSQQVLTAIRNLRCFLSFILPGSKACDETRLSNQEAIVQGDYQQLPNIFREIPEVCLQCMAFQPALNELSKLLPEQ